MVPIANRVDKNTFNVNGKTIHLPKVEWDSEFFLHGDGWKKKWTVYDETQDEITLTLISHINEYINYLASLTFKVSHSKLDITLKVKNLSPHPFPFNIGLHPYFCSNKKSFLRIPHKGYWPETHKHLPLPYQEQVPAQYNFQTFKALTQGWINHCYTVNSFVSDLINYSLGYRIEIHYSTDYLTVYQPHKHSPYICIEPQSYPINAQNMMDVPVVASGEEQKITMSIRVYDI